MLNDSLSQGSLICLSYAYFFSTSEPEYAYKRYAYKKKQKTCNNAPSTPGRYYFHGRFLGSGY